MPRHREWTDQSINVTVASGAQITPINFLANMPGDLQTVTSARVVGALAVISNELSSGAEGVQADGVRGWHGSRGLGLH